MELFNTNGRYPAAGKAAGNRKMEPRSADMPDTPLDPLEQRVLGVLVEKELSTPEYYPLTLNALVNGCNQSSNRDPVLAATEEEVQAALEGLRDRRLAATVQGAGARALKYAQRITEERGLTVQEAAILAELLLRGPQTPGELRGRSARMYPFQDLTEVDAALSLLAEAEPGPLVVKLPRAPGTKESRYAHLLGGPVSMEAESAPASPAVPGAPGLGARVAALEAQLEQLRQEFEAFRKQFD
jgi:uncharacterized protein